MFNKRISFDAEPDSFLNAIAGNNRNKLFDDIFIVGGLEILRFVQCFLW